jgi:Mg-chelatase subunit ChlD
VQLVLAQDAAARQALEAAFSARRVQEAMSQPAMREEMPQAQEQELRLSVSDAEILQKKDFAQMSAAEVAQVIRAIAKMRLPQAELVTRRHRPDPRGLRLDMRRTIRRSLRTSGEIIDIRKLGRIEKPAPIVALLDISGSMSTYATRVDNQPITRMELMKYGLIQMVNSLKDGDVINIITFSTDSWINYQGLVYPQDANTYLTFINSLQPTNTTNLNAGLVNGYTAALATFDPAKMNRVVLATDAYANTGEINPNTISQNIVINGREGIYFSALGISADVNEAFINTLTEAGKGGYYAITTRTDAVRAFEERFIALLSVAARDVRFRLDYPLSMSRDLDTTASEQSSVNPEDVQPTNFSYNTKQYFYEGFLTETAPAGTAEQFTLTIYYKDPETGAEKTEKIVKSLGEILGLDNTCIRDAETIYLFTQLFGLSKSWSAINSTLKTYYSDYSSLLFTEYKTLMQKYAGTTLSVSPASITFGQVAPGAVASKRLSIINGEVQDVRVLNVYFDAATAAKENMRHTAQVPVTLANLDAYDFDVILNTTVSGVYSGTLTIETDSQVKPKLTITCTGTVGTPTVPPPTTVPPTPTPTSTPTMTPTPVPIAVP